MKTATLPRPVNFAEAARIAAISRAPLSFVLNKKPGGGKATRQRVESVLARINYRPYG